MSDREFLALDRKGTPKLLAEARKMVKAGDEEEASRAVVACARLPAQGGRAGVGCSVRAGNCWIRSPSSNGAARLPHPSSVTPLPQQILFRDFEGGGAAVTARRFLSLAGREGDTRFGGGDDYFSTDFTDAQLRAKLAPLRRAPVLFLLSGADEYVADDDDHAALGHRMAGETRAVHAVAVLCCALATAMRLLISAGASPLSLLAQPPWAAPRAAWCCREPTMS